MVVSYLQWLGELNEVSLHSLAGVDLRAQADHLAPQFQTLLVQSCLTNTEITVTWNPCLFDFNISQLKKKKGSSYWWMLKMKTNHQKNNKAYRSKSRLQLLSHCWGSCWCFAHERAPPGGLPVQCGTPAAQPATAPSERGSSLSRSSDWKTALHIKKNTYNKIQIQIPTNLKL